LACAKQRTECKNMGNDKKPPPDHKSEYHRKMIWQRKKDEAMRIARIRDTRDNIKREMPLKREIAAEKEFDGCDMLMKYGIYEGQHDPLAEYVPVDKDEGFCRDCCQRLTDVDTRLLAGYCLRCSKARARIYKRRVRKKMSPKPDAEFKSQSQRRTKWEATKKKAMSIAREKDHLWIEMKWRMPQIVVSEEFIDYFGTVEYVTQALKDEPEEFEDYAFVSVADMREAFLT